MPTPALDIGSPVAAGRYPAHGWAENSQGIRLLWLPIVRVVFKAFDVRKQNGLEDLRVGQYGELLSFKHTLGKLVLTLRELKGAERLVASCQGANAKSEDSADVRALIPLYTDLTYVYLRRLADCFAVAMRYRLFANVESAPRKYTKLRERIVHGNDVRALQPLCNIAMIAKAIQEHSHWFDTVRDSNFDDGTVRKGIRDRLEHHPVTIETQSSQVGDEPWTVQAWVRISDTRVIDVLGAIPELLIDLCALFTDVATALSIDTTYSATSPPVRDVVFATGNDEDTTGFWPAL